MTTKKIPGRDFPITDENRDVWAVMDQERIQRYTASLELPPLEAPDIEAALAVERVRMVTEAIILLKKAGCPVYLKNDRGEEIELP